jgi:hypothetical protein
MQETGMEWEHFYGLFDDASSIETRTFKKDTYVMLDYGVVY